ncbi:hypothetical protein V6N12_006988 [Hibiscus sabdariffa]|uniref:Uncharacterized protein n=1 Tax=Hibiscus sabdariffa TaxID=183260 RepID=A0ABR2F0H4_9ROSI
MEIKPSIVLRTTSPSSNSISSSSMHSSISLGRLESFMSESLYEGVGGIVLGGIGILDLSSGPPPSGGSSSSRRCFLGLREESKGFSIY